MDPLTFETRAAAIPKPQSPVTPLLAMAGVAAGVVWAASKFLITPEHPLLALAGKTVLITGGSRGFGLALAEALGSRGAKLALCARDQAELERAKTQLQGKSIEAKVFEADITAAAKLPGLISEIETQLGPLDILINNAGEISVGPFESKTVADFQKAMDLMFWAPVNLTYTVLPGMLKRGAGHIVNIASVGGRVSVPHLLPYCAAKSALVGFSNGLSLELDAKGVQVLTVIPGLMRTGSFLKAKFSAKKQVEFDWFSLLGNLPGFSVAAQDAAAEVVRSLRRGEKSCTISAPAKLLIALDALVPELNQQILSQVVRFMPDSVRNGAETEGASLSAQGGKWLSALTVLGQRAAQRWNER